MYYKYKSINHSCDIYAFNWHQQQEIFEIFRHSNVTVHCSWKTKTHLWRSLFKMIENVSVVIQNWAQFRSTNVDRYREWAKRWVVVEVFEYYFSFT